MEKTELMLGDWVIFEGQPFRVGELTKIGVRGRSKKYAGCIISANYKDLEPMPLHPAILENIDGAKSIYHPERYEGDIISVPVCASFILAAGVVVEYTPEKEFLLDFSVEEAEYKHGSAFNINAYIDYVHELQHALKLAGVDKDIVL